MGRSGQVKSSIDLPSSKSGNAPWPNWDENNAYSLPTLGMTKYKEVDLAINPENPFKFYKATEKLLVVRERDREFKEIHKLEKEHQRVFEKEIGSRPTRKGAMREIR